jgi:hypothetical protein
MCLGQKDFVVVVVVVVPIMNEKYINRAVTKKELES